MVQTKDLNVEIHGYAVYTARDSGRFRSGRPDLRWPETPRVRVNRRAIEKDLKAKVRYSLLEVREERAYPEHVPSKEHQEALGKQATYR